MKIEYTLTSKKTWVEEYPDNNFSDEVLESNFWLWTYKEEDYFDEKCTKLKMKRTHIDEKVEEE